MRHLLKRTLYLGYYLKETDRERLQRFVAYVCQERGISRLALYADVLRSVYQYNVSVLDYFYFRFFERSAAERAEWAGTGYMYEYQRVMNPADARAVLEDKVRFLQYFGRFIHHPFATLDALKNDMTLAQVFINDVSGKIVVKDSKGQAGRGVMVINSEGLDSKDLVRIMEAKGYDLAEGYVMQHPELMALSPSGLNTIRVFTELGSDGDVRLLGVRLRISVNSTVDNLAAGNLAAPVDAKTGKVEGPGVYSDITRADEVVHPVTGIHIPGFQLPFWDETRAMVKEAARLTPENRSVGWDVAVTSEGPELIEGNHNWCKLLWQLPVKQGLKHLLVES